MKNLNEVWIVKMKKLNKLNYAFPLLLKNSNQNDKENEILSKNDIFWQN